jgi:RHS repeat-associated protein
VIGGRRSRHGAEGNKTTYGYDGLDRLAVTYFPSATKGAGTSSTTDYEQLTYDAGGNVTNRRLRDTNNIGVTYDALNRVTAKNLPGSEPDVAYTYDALGRMTGASQTGNSLSFTFDALNRELTEVGPQGTVTSTWDIAGRRTRIAHPDGFYVDQDYLVTGEPSAIRENGATSGAGVLATYAYDDLGRRTSLTRGDGSVLGYSYDAVSRLSQLADNLSGTTYDQTLGFTYTPASQIAATTRSNDNYAWGAHYNVTKSYTANGLNQYTVAGSASPTYDSKGNLTSAGSTTFSYSSENLLTGATGSIALAYDPALRLYQTSGGASGTTRLAYDGANLIAEYNSSNAMLRRYVHGPGSDEPIAWYEGSGTTDRRFLHQDERGSVVAVTNSSGTVLGVNSYDEYGVPASANLGRFQYTGQTWLSDLGLYYYKARMYSTGLGRFLQTDPIGYRDGMNMYGYVGGDAVNFTDPTGTSKNSRTLKPPVRPNGTDVAGDGSGDTVDQGPGLVVIGSSMAPSAALAFGYTTERGRSAEAGAGDVVDEVGITVVGGRRRRHIATVAPVVVETPSLDPYTFFKHYTQDNGETVCLTPDQFRRLTETSRVVGRQNPNGANLVSFYGGPLESTFGSATMRYRDGHPVAFHDRYDFNMTGAQRSLGAHIKTLIGRATSGTPFDVRYPC